MSVKRKPRIKISLTEKLDIIKQVKNSPTEKRADIAKRLGINASTLNQIVQKRDVILKASLKYGTDSINRKSCKNSPVDELEKELVNWFNKLTSEEKERINGTILRKKAFEIATKNEVPNFKASRGWLIRFKKRNSIDPKKPRCVRREDINNDDETTDDESSLKDEDEIMEICKDSSSSCNTILEENETNTKYVEIIPYSEIQNEEYSDLESLNVSSENENTDTNLEETHKPDVHRDNAEPKENDEIYFHIRHYDNQKKNDRLPEHCTQYTTTLQNQRDKMEDTNAMSESVPSYREAMEAFHLFRRYMTSTKLPQHIVKRLHLMESDLTNIRGIKNQKRTKQTLLTEYFK